MVEARRSGSAAVVEAGSSETAVADLASSYSLVSFDAVGIGPLLPLSASTFPI